MKGFAMTTSVLAHSLKMRISRSPLGVEPVGSSAFTLIVFIIM